MVPGEVKETFSETTDRSVVVPSVSESASHIIDNEPATLEKIQYENKLRLAKITEYHSKIWENILNAQVKAQENAVFSNLNLSRF